MSLIEANGLCKTYQAGDISIEAITEASFTIEAGSFVSFVGPSGSGKSTLLNMIGCLDSPSCGELRVVDTDVSKLNHKQAAIFRGSHIGFVFQDFNLIPVLSVYENVEYPLVMVQNWSASKRRQQVMELLDAVGMKEQANKLPSQLSGGQKQRVAIARALVTNCKLVLADEPTANLDSVTAHRVIDLMKSMREKFDTTFIFSTHDPKIMAEAEVTYTLVDGRIDNKEMPSS
ncbi:MAG: ABC transporter ATP-binding protein [Thioalkalispiraceae bacterium]|jgi:putative ABC transport system ATP-binding protein